MDTQELIRQILKRLNRFKFLLLIAAASFAVLLYLYAKSKPAEYSVLAKLFPINNSQDNSIGSKVTDLFGGSSQKSLSDEANVNIEEVAKSKKTRYEVVSARLPEFNNKMIAELLIAEYNRTATFLTPKIIVSTADVIPVGAALLQKGSSVKFSKTALLEVGFSSTQKELLIPVDNVMIEKITLFYKELKIEKAKFDYDFIQAKVDSFDAVLHSYDSKRIRMSNTTLFVPKERLQYAIPQENLESEKLRVLAQRNNASLNREEALWRLQKLTPIVKVLDSPSPPYGVNQPSASVYAAAGFFIGLIFFSLLLVGNLLYRYSTRQLQAALAPKPLANTSTTA